MYPTKFFLPCEDEAVELAIYWSNDCLTPQQILNLLTFNHLLHCLNLVIHTFLMFQIADSRKKGYKAL